MTQWLGSPARASCMKLTRRRVVRRAIVDSRASFEASTRHSPATTCFNEAAAQCHGEFLALRRSLLFPLVALTKPWHNTTENPSAVWSRCIASPGFNEAMAQHHGERAYNRVWTYNCAIRFNQAVAQHHGEQCW